MAPFYTSTTATWNGPITATSGLYYFQTVNSYSTAYYGLPAQRVRMRPPSRSGPSPYQRPARALVAVQAARMPERRGRAEARPSRALRQRRRQLTRA